MSKERQDWFLSIANTPQRKLSRAKLDQACRGANGRFSTLEVLQLLIDDAESPLTRTQREQVDGLLTTLQRTFERVSEEPDLSAGDLIEWLAKTVGYESHFDDYYGKGEHSADRKLAIANLIRYAKSTELDAVAFLAHVEMQDPTQGAPKHQQVMMTTIFKTKGLEYDYVVMPHCEEGYLPCLYGAEVHIFDTAGIVKEPEASEALENERRLFYVGITRARKAVLIGTSRRPEKGYLTKQTKPSRFLEEIQLESVVGVVPILQRLRTGGPDARNEMVGAIHRWGGCAWIKQTLVESYVASLRDDRLTGELAALLAKISVEPFSYKEAYESVTKVRGSKDPHEQVGAPPEVRKIINQPNGREVWGQW
jgi:superfamily I DNA/RNA helicase